MGKRRVKDLGIVLWSHFVGEISHLTRSCLEGERFVETSPSEVVGYCILYVF